MSKKQTARAAAPTQDADTLGGAAPAADDTTPATEAATEATEAGDSTAPAEDPRAAALASLVAATDDTPRTPPAAPEQPVTPTDRVRTFHEGGTTYLVHAPRFSTSHAGRVVTAYRGDLVVVDPDAAPVQHAIEHGYLRPVE